MTLMENGEYVERKPTVSQWKISNIDISPMDKENVNTGFIFITESLTNDSQNMNNNK